MVIIWLWSFVPKLKLGLGILGEFCTDIQDEVLGAGKLAKKWLHVVSHSGILHLQYISSYFFTHFLLYSRCQENKNILNLGQCYFFCLIKVLICRFRM